MVPLFNLPPKPETPPFVLVRRCLNRGGDTGIKCDVIVEAFELVELCNSAIESSNLCNYSIF